MEEVKEKKTETVTVNEQEEKKTEKTEKKNQKTKNYSDFKIPFSFWLKVIIVNVVVSLLVLFAYHRYFGYEVAIVDLSGYINGLRNLYVSGKINDQELKKKIDEAVALIERESKNRIVFLSEVVLGKNPKVKVISLPQLPPEAYSFNLQEYLKNLRNPQQEGSNR